MSPRTLDCGQQPLDRGVELRRGSQGCVPVGDSKFRRVDHDDDSIADECLIQCDVTNGAPWFDRLSEVVREGFQQNQPEKIGVVGYGASSSPRQDCVTGPGM